MIWPVTFSDAVTIFIEILSEDQKIFLREQKNLVDWDVGDHLNYIVQHFGLAKEENMPLLFDIAKENPDSVWNESPFKNYADPKSGAMLIIHGAQARLKVESR
jgi:hypothetical protein